MYFITTKTLVFQDNLFAYLVSIVTSLFLQISQTIKVPYTSSFTLLNAQKEILVLEKYAGILNQYIQAGDWQTYFNDIFALAIILCCALVSFYFSRFIITRAIKGFLVGRKNRWLLAIFSTQLLDKLSWLATITAIAFGVDSFLPATSPIFTFVDRLVMSSFVITMIFMTTAILGNINQIPKCADRRQIFKTYTDAAKIIVYILGLIFIASIFTGTSPWGIFSVLGGLTAVVMLVFRDSILGFVASIKVASMGLVKVGDWVEMDQFGANGDVIDISIHSVKIQNWDKTITTIPTHLLVNNSFRNWRGMSESGGRRIKRSINLDMESISFCDQSLYEKIVTIKLLKEYVETNGLISWNEKTDSPLNNESVTNVKLFREYTIAYLHSRPDIHKNMTFLVRQLQPTAQGLPIEIYVFSARQEWAIYETIQAEIFEHLISALPEFGLRIYQQPTGYNLEQIKGAVSSC